MNIFKLFIALFIVFYISLAHPEVAYERAIKVVCIEMSKAMSQVGAIDSMQYFMDPAGNKWMIMQKSKEVVILLVAQDKPKEACFVSYGNK